MLVVLLRRIRWLGWYELWVSCLLLLLMIWTTSACSLQQHQLKKYLAACSTPHGL
jgi:hypothetical protein